MHNFVPIHTANTSYIQLVAFDIFFKAALNILEAISKQSLIITNETDTNGADLSLTTDYKLSFHLFKIYTTHVIISR